MPTPEEAATTEEECRHVLDLPEEPEPRQIALWKVESNANEESAAGRIACRVISSTRSAASDCCGNTS
jgi:hypothetical protein